MSYVQPRLGVFNAVPFFFTQQPSQSTVISSQPRTRLNESVQNIVTSQKSVPNSVTQTTETKVTDKEVIVLSSDSESDTEARRPIVSRKMKGKGKEGIGCVNEGMKNTNLKTPLLDQTPTPNSDVNKIGVVKENDQCVDSLSNNITISNSIHENGVSTNKKNLLDNYALTSNKGQSSLFQLVNPVRIFLNILEDHNINVGLTDIIVDFTRIYLEIYEEDKRIIQKLHDHRTLVTDLLYCLMSKIKDDNYVATSKRFKQVELLARKAIEEIEKLRETGEIPKRIDDYNKARRFQCERKRRNEEGDSLQEEKRRRQDHDKRFAEEKRRREYEIKREFERQREQRKRELDERRLRQVFEKASVRKEWEELEKKMKSQGNMANYINRIPPSKRLDHPSMPAPPQFVPCHIRPRMVGNNEAELAGLLSEPLHDLITTQIVYNLYRHFTPFRMSETVGRCSVDKIFRLNFSERMEYCKQLYRQYVNTNMDGTAKAIESWIKTRILLNASLNANVNANTNPYPYCPNRRW